MRSIKENLIQELIWGTRIFRIWIPSKNRIIRSRDVIFDDNLFYDPKDLDLGATLPESVERMIEYI